MDVAEIPAIKSADELLRAAEKTFPSQESAAQFLRAFETLNNLMQLEDPGSETAKFVDKLKLSQLSAAIARLRKVGKKDFDQHVHYILAVFFHLDGELTRLREVDPKIATTLNTCRTKFKPQIDKFVAAL